MPDDGKLWTKTIRLGPDRPGGGPTLDFLKMKTDDRAVQTLPFTNTSDLGAQCRLHKSDETTFLGHLAGGLSHDYAHLADGQRIPEVLFGFQVEHQVTQRHKVLGAIDYAHDVTDFGRHRIRTQAAWEVLLDPERNISLRTGILESSSKASSGEQATSLNYSLDFIWKF